MYNYEWDPETGGYLLTTKASAVIKEVRPVFFEELKLLGFDRQFNWEIPDTESPLMWAEGRRYVYRGNVIGEVSGGGLYQEPVLKSEFINLKIEPVNIALMIEKNQTLMNGLVQKTLKFIYSTFIKYKKKVDFTYVAFSGGKDSLVLLDLVQRALPHDKFHVIFADTTMEMDDTYISVKLANERWNDLNWHTAKSHLTAPDSWKLIGAPAQKLRWCCSIHKTVPQVLLIKNLLKKDRFNTLVFVGVRAEESQTRSQYNDISKSTKHVMQTGCYPIHEWNTTELFLYILEHELLLNKAYRKGLSRAGCIFCPMSSNWSFLINGKLSPNRTEEFVETVSSNLNQRFLTAESKNKYFNDAQWRHRLSGRDIKLGSNKLIETIEGGYHHFRLINPTTNWVVWLSTIGHLYKENDQLYILEYAESFFTIKFEQIGKDIKISIPIMERSSTSIRLLHLIRNAFYKTLYCIGCKLCEAECPVGAIKFIDGELTISGCINCHKCLDLQYGCIVAKSQVIPIGGAAMIKRSFSGYYTRGLRKDWLNLYFELGSDFWGNERLGKNMFLSLKVWLKEAGLLSGLTITPLGQKLSTLGTNNLLVWATIFTNLAYNSSLINWYVTELDAFYPFDNQALKTLLGEKHSSSVKESAISSLKETLKTTPLGSELETGVCEMKGNTVLSITKNTWNNPEPLAILYSLYKFAEEADRYFSFTLTDLLSDSPDRKGISPARLFNLSKETVQQILYQLSLDYSSFIKVVFNKDLENVYLNSEKTSLDIVELFNEGATNGKEI